MRLEMLAAIPPLVVSSLPLVAVVAQEQEPIQEVVGGEELYLLALSVLIQQEAQAAALMAAPGALVEPVEILVVLVAVGEAVKMQLEVMQDMVAVAEVDEMLLE